MRDDTQSALAVADSQILMEAGRLFAHTRDSRFIARSLCLMVMGRTLAPRCALLLRPHDAGGGFEIGYRSGFTEKGDTSQPSEQTPVHVAVPATLHDLTGALTLYWSGKSASDRWDGVREVEADCSDLIRSVFPAAPTQTGRWLVCPLRVDGDLLGLMILAGHGQEDALSPSTVEWIESLCQSAAIAFQNVAYRLQMERLNASLRESNLALEESNTTLARVNEELEGSNRALVNTNRALDHRLHELQTLYEVSREFGAQLQRPRIASILRLTLLGQFRIQRFVMLSRAAGGSGAVREGEEGARDTGGALGSGGAPDAGGPLGSDGKTGAGGASPAPSGTGVHSDVEIVASSGVRDLPTGKQLEGIFRLHEQEATLLVEQPLFLPCSDSGLLGSGITGFVTIYQEDRLIALVGIGLRSNGEGFREEDLHLVRSISTLALLSMDKTRLLEEMLERKALLEEIQLARKIQTQLLPDPLPQMVGLDAAALNIPSKEVGGDYYDVAQTPDGNHVIAIGDVSGKGIPASLLMANLQAMLHVLLPVEISLSEAMGRINDLLVQNTPSDRFITFFLGKFDGERSEFHYVNAGHNPPLLLRNGSDDPEWLHEGGLLLGALPTLSPYATGVITLQPGDVLVLYTDGVTEAQWAEPVAEAEKGAVGVIAQEADTAVGANAQGTAIGAENHAADTEFGTDRLVTSVLAHRAGSAISILEGVRGDVETFCGGRRSDDFTLLVVKRV